MKARVSITKSFDKDAEFTKKWEAGDFEEFFKDEGAYLDRLSKLAADKGEAGDGFTVTYTVEVRK